MAKDIEKRIFDMEDDVSDLKPTFILYGQEGCGKTTCVSYAPNLFLIDAEDGRASIVKTPNRPKVFKVNDVEDLTEVYIYLKANQDKYGSVAIDTMTEVESMFIAESIRRQCDKDPNKDPDRVTQDDYGRASQRMQKMGRKFRSLDMYTFFICHEREDKDDSTGIIKKGPALMPSVMKKLNGFVDFILYMGLDSEGNRNILTQPTNKIRAKHRIGKLPKVIELGQEVEDCRIDTVLDMIDNTSKGDE